MTRRRENLSRMQNAQGSEDPKHDGRYQEKKNRPVPPVRPKGPSFIQSVLCDNWKQQSMVKKNSSQAHFGSMCLFM